jgi:hypothetical protein
VGIDGGDGKAQGMAQGWVEVITGTRMLSFPPRCRATAPCYAMLGVCTALGRKA